MSHDDLNSAIFFLLISIGVSVESFRIGIGHWNVPGPGLFPLLAAVLLGCLSISLGFKCFNKRPGSRERSWYKEVLWKRWGITVGAMFAYAILLERIGFIVCTFFLINGLVISVKPQGLKTALILAIAATLVSHLLFRILLNVQLPKGLFGW